MTNIITAEQFIAQGTSASAILSIAKYQTDRKTAGALRAIALDVARLTGTDLGGRRRSAANQNAPRSYGKPANGTGANSPFSTSSKKIATRGLAA